MATAQNTAGEAAPADASHEEAKEELHIDEPLSGTFPSEQAALAHVKDFAIARGFQTKYAWVPARYEIRCKRWGKPPAHGLRLRAARGPPPCNCRYSAAVLPPVEGHDEKGVWTLLPSSKPHNHGPWLGLADLGTSEDESSSGESETEAKIDLLDQKAWEAYDERFLSDPLQVVERSAYEESVEELGWERHAASAQSTAPKVDAPPSTQSQRQSLKRKAEREPEPSRHKKGLSWKQADRTSFFMTTRKTDGPYLRTLKKPVFRPPREISGSWMQQFQVLESHFTNLNPHNLKEIESRVGDPPTVGDDPDNDRRGDDPVTFASSMAPEKHKMGARAFEEYVDQWNALPARSPLVSDPDAVGPSSNEPPSNEPPAGRLRLPRKELLQALLTFASDFAEQSQPVPHYGYDLIYSCDPSALVAMGVLCQELVTYLMLGSGNVLSDEELAATPGFKSLLGSARVNETLHSEGLE
ncbi:hypothetical protein HDU87_005603 [Geranomyces variabilis]|uniref:Uncharacterized protein n=1 Tax=Geranomyces variabilis TaxID=109894 RepID=A0AAD5XKY6_9FUNG|nr:hypothetical protein HDU87_005603 [Geranomyces variabilis]